MKGHTMKHTLVAYKGGGYDGCFWEWNYAYFDKEGGYHSIFASGRLGCETLEDFKEAYANRPDDFQFYKLKNKKDRVTLGKREPISRLLYLAKWFGEEGVELELPVKCDECGEVFDLMNEDNLPQGVEERGRGGIMMEYSKIICGGCYSSGTCDCCGEYVGAGHITDYGCVYCDEIPILERES
jgi:hypothetical protein